MAKKIDVQEQFIKLAFIRKSSNIGCYLTEGRSTEVLDGEDLLKIGTDNLVTMQIPFYYKVENSAINYLENKLQSTTDSVTITDPENEIEVEALDYINLNDQFSAEASILVIEYTPLSLLRKSSR